MLPKNEPTPAKVFWMVSTGFTISLPAYLIGLMPAFTSALVYYSDWLSFSSSASARSSLSRMRIIWSPCTVNGP